MQGASKAELMAAPTNAACVKKARANEEPSTHGTSRHFEFRAALGRFRSEADINSGRSEPGWMQSPRCSLGHKSETHIRFIIEYPDNLAARSSAEGKGPTGTTPGAFPKKGTN